MTEKPSDPDQNAVPEDIATLYSRAHMQGTKYWDFSASRKEVRGQFRHRLVREQAERAGAALGAQPVRPVREQTSAPQLSPQLPAQQFQAPARSGPIRASAARPPSEVREESRAPQLLPQPKKGAPPRWYALHSVFAPAEAAAADHPPAQAVNPLLLPPIAVVFSLAGGVGKTCLVATLGRALSSLGEHVLLADTAVCGLLPFYFGSREFKPGVVRTFSSGSPAGAESDVPVSVLNLEADRYPGDGGEDDLLLGELVRDGSGSSRILVDVATASRDVTTRLLALRPAVLVPILPDMSSVASLGSLDAFLSRDGGAPHYLLNQFDISSPLHIDLRDMLQQQLGDRLLPFVLRRSAAVSEALAEGMTVIDYAPNSAAAEDYWNLADWLRSVAAPAAVGFGGVRWSER